MRVEPVKVGGSSKAHRHQQQTAASEIFLENTKQNDAQKTVRCSVVDSKTIVKTYYLAISIPDKPLAYVCENLKWQSVMETNGQRAA
jgi:hypothetical protein